MIRSGACALALIGFLGCVLQAEAMVIAGDDISKHETAPLLGEDAYGFGWETIGKTKTWNLAAVYIGDSWFCTANHVMFDILADDPNQPIQTHVMLGGVEYEIDQDSIISGGAYNHWIFPPGLGRGDYCFFKVTTEPPAELAPTLAIEERNVGDTVVICGNNGFGRASEKQYWYVDGTDATESDYDYSGYYYHEAGRKKRWGYSTILARNSYLFNGNDGDGRPLSGDSGAGVFAKNNLGDWELIGIVTAIGNRVGPFPITLPPNYRVAIDGRSYSVGPSFLDMDYWIYSNLFCNYSGACHL